MSLPNTTPTSISQLQEQLRAQAIAKRGGATIENMDTSGRSGSGLVKLADNLATVIENCPPLEYIANKLDEGKQAAIDAIEEEVEKMQDKFEDFFEAAKEDAQAKLAKLAIVNSTPDATGGDEGASAAVLANSIKAYLVLAYAEITQQVADLGTAAGRITTAVSNQVSAMQQLVSTISSLPDPT